MTSKTSWSRIVAEGTLIVASILMALALEAWWSGTQARRVAYADLAAVLNELEESREVIERSATWHARMLVGTRSLRDLLETVPLDTDVWVSDTLLLQPITVTVTDPPASILQAFLASGSVREIPQGALRQQLLGWGATLEDLRDDEVHVRDLVDQNLAPYLLHEADMTGAGEQVNAMWLGIDAPESRTVSLRSSQPLRSMVGWQVAWFVLLTAQSEAALGQLDSLIELVQEEVQAGGAF